MAQSMDAIAPSIAYPFPHESRTIDQPISVPGQPSGCQGPSRPSPRPVSFSITENIANPWTCHEPIIVISCRQQVARGMTPPMKRAVGSSCIIAVHGSRSSRRGGRRSSRGVSMRMWSKAVMSVLLVPAEARSSARKTCPA